MRPLPPQRPDRRCARDRGGTAPTLAAAFALTLAVALALMAMAAPASAADEEQSAPVDAEITVEGLDDLTRGEPGTVAVTLALSDPGPLPDDAQVQILGRLDTNDGDVDPAALDVIDLGSVEGPGEVAISLDQGHFLFPSQAEAPEVGALTEAPRTFLVRVEVPEAAPAGLTVELAVSRVAPSVDQRRLAGEDGDATAAAISQEHHPDGADVAYLANGAEHADALSAAPAAARAEAPLLLASSSALPQVTRDELARLDPDEVVLLGGEAALSPAVADAVADLGPQVTRLAGEDRYATAAKVARTAFDAADTALLATGEGFADALSGAAAAAAQDLPILQTRSASLPSTTASALEALGVERVVVLGGEQAVAPAVVDDLEARGLAVERLFGDDRFATSAAVARALFEPSQVEAAYLATGEEFADALAGAPAAGAEGAPLLLAGSTVGAALAEPVTAAIADLGPSRLTGLGGSAVLADASLEQGIDAASTTADDPSSATPLSSPQRLP